MKSECKHLAVAEKGTRGSCLSGEGLLRWGAVSATIFWTWVAAAGTRTQKTQIKHRQLALPPPCTSSHLSRGSVLTQVDFLQRTPMALSGNLLTQESRDRHSETTSASPGSWDCFFLCGHKSRSARTRASGALRRRKASDPASASAICSRKSKDKEGSWGKCILPPTQSPSLNSGSEAMGLASVFTVRGHGVSGGVHGHCGMPVTY